MIVRVEFNIKTTDFGKEEFKKEIEELIKEIFPDDSELLDFEMFQILQEYEKDYDK